jgi:phosphoribosyl-AMP cyclohydrolase
LCKTEELGEKSNYDGEEIEAFIKKIDFSKSGDGLVPVISQDAESKDILMLAYANEQALRYSFTTGIAHYWSRSRKSLWKKGDTSGHVQKIRAIDTDCDHDTLLYLVDQVGVACHRGTWSCFDIYSQKIRK